jgi:uncharacterized damage-inducible protein DinB
MPELTLPPVDGYDPESQRTVALLAASLDDQLRRLKESVDGLFVTDLEWQPAPGRNTIGMLLAHIAVAEAWWLQAGAKGIFERDQVKRIVKGVIGIEAQEDGMPLPEGGAHPEVLRNKTLADYLSMIDRARVATHVVLRGWADADLDERVQIRDRSVSKSWILYHVFEHMVGHYGQILLLLSLMRSTD